MQNIFINQTAIRVIASALMLTVVIPGCLTDRLQDGNDQPEVSGEILTEDPNGDGIVDREFHDSDYADGDWEMILTGFTRSWLSAGLEFLNVMFVFQF